MTHQKHPAWLAAEAAAARLVHERDTAREKAADLAASFATGPYVHEARVMAGAIAAAIREGGQSGCELTRGIERIERERDTALAEVRVLRGLLGEVRQLGFCNDYNDGFDRSRVREMEERVALALRPREAAPSASTPTADEEGVDP